MAKDMDDFLNTEQAGKEMRPNVSPRRVRKLIDDGRIPAKRYGGRGQWFIRRGDILEFNKTR